MRIKTIVDTLSETQIIETLQGRDNSINIVKVDCIYYPFAKLIYAVTMKKGLMQKFDRKMMCNIDLVHGRPAIGQGKPIFAELEIEDIMAIPSQIEETVLDGIGHDYVMKIFIGKMKILHTPQIAVDNIEFFHKLFYLVQCKDKEEEDYFLLVDSMDGSLAILDY